MKSLKNYFIKLIGGFLCPIFESYSQAANFNLTNLLRLIPGGLFLAFYYFKFRIFHFFMG